MFLGMTRDEYWNAGSDELHDYRAAHELKRVYENQKLHLQGMYFADAIASVIFPKEVKYPAMPYPITKVEKQISDEEERRAQIEQAKAYMVTAMKQINDKRREEAEKNAEEHRDTGN